MHLSEASYAKVPPSYVCNTAFSRSLYSKIKVKWTKADNKYGIKVNHIL
jgi:hypothetical protein